MVEAVRTGTVAVIGTGRVGTAMAGLLSSGGCRVVAVHDACAEAAAAAGRLSGARVAGTPADAAGAASAVLITTPDDAIGGVCREACESTPDLAGKVFVHMSGALGLSALEAAAAAGARVLSVHPLQTFADAGGALRSIPGSTFGVTCGPGMEEWALEFVSVLGGNALFVRDSDRVLYHAAAVMACNALVMVEHASLWMCGLLGMGEDEAGKAFAPLVRATVENVVRLGPEAALTGPLARGDAGTIAAHLEALSPYPELEGMYRAVCLWGLRIVETRGEVGPEAVRGMRRLLLRDGEDAERGLPAGEAGGLETG